MARKRGLWDNIHAKRKRGERPAKPGEKGYPKTLDIMKEGGKLKGPSHSKGGIDINVEGGEYIVKKDSVNKETQPVLEKINKTGKLPKGIGYNFPTADARERSKK
jgi:hypothetical protein